MVWLWIEIQHFRRDRRAVTSVEYVLIASLASTVILGGVTSIGGNLASTFRALAAAF